MDLPGGRPERQYTQIMSRWPLLFLLAGTLAAQQTETKRAAEKQESPSAAPAPGQLPPEEDTAVKPEEFGFNPVRSKRDVTVGNLYFKKGNFKAAANRYSDATKWNEGNAEAWLRLGEAEEKRDNFKAARIAYEKYLELAPDSKPAAEVKKRLEKLKG